MTTQFTAPVSRDIWTTTLAHPLAGRPLTERVDDAACDAVALAACPEGWALHACYQARDERGERVLRVTYHRLGLEPFAASAQRHDLDTRHPRARLAPTGWNVYRTNDGDGADQTLIGSAATESEAHALALREGGDQIQRGLDGAVVNVDRANWSERARVLAAGRVSWRDVTLTDGDGNLTLEADGSARYAVDGEKTARVDPGNWIAAMRELRASDSMAGYWACSASELKLSGDDDPGLGRDDIDWTGFDEAVSS